MENFYKFLNRRGDFLCFVILVTLVFFYPYPLHAFNDFEYEGITYRVVSESDRTVEVINPNLHYYYYDKFESYKPSPYNGDIVIKGEVKSDSNVYTVIGIKKAAFYCSKVKSLILPNTIKKIEEEAFHKCENLEKINLEDLTIEELPSEVFWGCSGLTSIDIPSSVKKIGEYAFSDCSVLETVIVPCSVRDIGKYAFSSCARLRKISLPPTINKISFCLFKDCGVLYSIDIPESVEEIETMAFSGCKNLREIVVPENVKSIESGAFEDCRYLRNIKLPSGLTEIPFECFSGCVSLEEITLPSGIKIIGTDAFRGCRLLRSVELPDELTEIGVTAFDGAISLSRINIPKSVTTIGQQAFGNCSLLKEITVDEDNAKYSSYDGALYSKNFSELIACPAGKESLKFHEYIKGIGYAACIGCSLLRSVDIPESIDHIGDFAFSGCTSLKTITLPFGFKRLCCDAFAGCERIETIYCKASTPPSFDEESLTAHQLLSGRYKGTFTYITKNNAMLYVPEESMPLYKGAYGWGEFKNVNTMDFSGVNNVEANNIVIYFSDGSVHIEGIDDSSIVEVYTIAGNKVYSGCERIVSNLANGIYIVKIGSLIRKVII